MHVTKHQSQSAFDPRTVTLAANSSSVHPYGLEIFTPLDGATFDRATHRSFWKGGLDDWLLHRPANEHVSHTGAGPQQQERSWEYGAGRGELLLERLHAQPDPAAGGQSHDDDIVTVYQWVASAADPGWGQARRRRTGLWQSMKEAGGIAERSEYIEYQHATPSRRWLLCERTEQSAGLEPGALMSTCTGTAAERCQGWQVPSEPPALAGLDLPAELVSEQAISSGWRLPTSGLDGNGIGVAVIGHDGLGRTNYLQPTDSRLSPTWIDYPSANSKEISVLDANSVKQLVAAPSTTALVASGTASSSGPVPRTLSTTRPSVTTVSEPCGAHRISAARPTGARPRTARP